MTILRFVMVLGAGLASFPAAAATFCYANGVRICDGCEGTKYVKVVVSTVPRPSVPGRPANRPWCTWSFTSLGGVYTRPQIVAKPSLGEMRISGNRVWYKSDRVGRDRAVVEYHWTSHINNSPQHGRINWEIEVVGAPL